MSAPGYRVLLAEALDPPAEERLATGATVIRAPAPDEDTLINLIGDCDALIVRTNTPVTRRLLAAGRRLRVVGVAGVGVERVDTAAAAAQGVAVLNTPAAASDAVAELTVTLILQLLRPVPRLAQDYRRGWYAAARAYPHGRELRELTVGIVGMGRIGTRVGRICAAGFGCRVLYNDIVPGGPFDFAAEAVDKAALWPACDVLTLHVPLTDPTRRLIDADVLARLRPGALLINTARGAVVDTAALTDALVPGRLGGAALDVTDPEPLPPEHPLFTLPNCILTPHIAARTHGSLQRMYAIVDDVLAFLRTHASPSALEPTLSEPRP